MQPLTVSTIQLLYTVKEKGGKLDRKLHPPPYGIPTETSENSQNYAQKPQRNCTFTNLASGMIVKGSYSVWSLPVEHYRPNRQTFVIRLPQNTKPFLPSRERDREEWPKGFKHCLATVGCRHKQHLLQLSEHNVNWFVIAG
jgi:hypothetical protein